MVCIVCSTPKSPDKPRFKLHTMAKNGVLIRHFDRQSLYTRLIDEMIPKESTVEKNTADSWVEQAKKLWNWISQKGEDEQQ